MRRKASTLWAVLMMAAASASYAGDEPYVMVLVEPLPGGSIPEAYFTDIAETELAVGFSAHLSFYDGFFWTLDNDKTVIPITRPRGVNNLNQMCGGASVYDSGTDTLTTIPFLDPDYPLIRAEGMNDHGVVVGYAEWRTGDSDGVRQYPIIWDPVGGTRTFDLFGARELLRVNNKGLAVGHIRLSAGDSEAFVYDIESGAVTNLHDLLSPSGAGTSDVYDINDGGVVTGTGWTGSRHRPFVWSAEEGFTFLPSLDGGPSMRVHPRGINQAREVCGWAMDRNDEWHAFLWSPSEGMRKLADLVFGSGDFVFDRVHKINDQGWIVGDGHTGPGFGLGEPFVLMPRHMELTLSADRISEGDALTFTTTYGQVESSGLLVLVELDGIPMFTPVLSGQFDADNEWNVNTVIPDGVGGHEAVFRTYGINAKGVVEATNPALLTLE